MGALLGGLVGGLVTMLLIARYTKGQVAETTDPQIRAMLESLQREGSAYARELAETETDRYLASTYGLTPARLQRLEALETRVRNLWPF